MTHIFDAYDDRLAHLSDSIQPLHEMITRLTKVLSNIQNTNQSFINVMSHFDVYADVRGYIENSSNLKDLDSYIDKMEKAKNAQTYFEENQLRGGQETLRELTELVEIGANKMTQNFYDVLKHNNRKCNFSGRWMCRCV
ncbi:hypothetical protein SARC_07632 [Sphaeroforma arctica JP610]|uniref:Uncharacterized protein n=1 Tax=Sphaeroforma arctica JP610 TaxID=667725 RepID=A0A0L0FT70_9EUKA|nr:hypothetical protein SARC_07632 [Sphaeroforma arctica JP610]KNC80000.1 hypothetical protein SARC_07632 [Sphaeroforma arctica JP610]|eukprot:XP_014153902.1 hypothetical protein SARC_07632 [Sphaeroforma arctica JP610]